MEGRGLKYNRILGLFEEHNITLELKNLKLTLREVKDWALINGIGMRNSKQNLDTISLVPFSLFPSVFPREEFKKVVSCQTLVNTLIHKVSHDRDFLSSTLNKVIEVDDFTKKLFGIYETVMEEGIAQDICLGILRSDYMLNEENRQLFAKQVEVNTIASSFGGLSDKVNKLHKYFLDMRGKQHLRQHIPDNPALEKIAQALIEAWKIYGKKNACLLYVVENVTTNICDQRILEYEINRQAPDIKVLRCTLSEISKNSSLNDKTKILLLYGEYEIAVTYFRCGYSPDQYPTSDEWRARLVIERSLSIKCPAINYHLAGTKKVQQALTSPDVIKKYITEESDVSAIMSLFVSLYSIDMDPDGDRNVEFIMKEPSKYVMKPQREGGGNNIYGMDIKQKLLEINEDRERCAWIVMDQIRPPAQRNIIVRSNVDEFESGFQNTISELGIFGVIIGNASEIFLNDSAGYMMRTKEEHVNEGGIAFGAGCLDSPFLV